MASSRTRNNLRRMWFLNAAAAAAAAITGFEYQMPGNSVALQGAGISATLSTPPATGGIPLTYLTTSAFPSGGTTAGAVTGISFGTASANRRIIIVFANRDVADEAAYAVTIGGVAATLHYTATQSTNTGRPAVTFASAIVPTGTTGNISCHYNSFYPQFFNIPFTLFSMDDTNRQNPSPTIYDFASKTLSTGRLTASCTISDGAVVIANLIVTSGDFAIGTASFSTGTEVSIGQIVSGWWYGMVTAYASSATGTLSADFIGNWVPGAPASAPAGALTVFVWR